MNEQIIKGKWVETKGAIQKMWGKLTDNELDETKGNLVAIGGLIQQKYGHAKDDVSAKLDTLIAKFADKAHDIKENVGELAARKTDEVKDNLKDSDKLKH